MNRITQLLNKDFTFLNEWYYKAIHIAVTLILCTFIIFGLNAFDISSWAKIPDWISFLGLYGFLLVGLVVMLISQVIIGFIFKDKTLQLRHLLIWLISEITLMTIVLTIVYGEHGYSFFAEWLTTSKYTSMIITLPYTTSLLLLNSFAPNKPIEQKKNISTTGLLNFSDEKNQTKFSVKSSHVLYIESSDNYVTIFYLDNDKLKKELVRNTLKRIENLFNDKGLLRCHRSFIINIANIEAIKKINRSYQIKIKHIDSAIPVSKSFIPAVKELIEEK